MEPQVGLKVKRIEAEAWAEPGPGMTLEALEAELRRLDHVIIEVDTDRGRIKVMQFKEEFNG